MVPCLWRVVLWGEGKGGFAGLTEQVFSFLHCRGVPRLREPLVEDGEWAGGRRRSGEPREDAEGVVGMMGVAERCFRKGPETLG